VLEDRLTESKPKGLHLAAGQGGSDDGENGELGHGGGWRRLSYEIDRELKRL